MAFSAQTGGGPRGGLKTPIIVFWRYDFLNNVECDYLHDEVCISKSSICSSAQQALFAILAPNMNLSPYVHKPKLNDIHIYIYILAEIGGGFQRVYIQMVRKPAKQTIKYAKIEFHLDHLEF